MADSEFDFRDGDSDDREDRPRRERPREEQSTRGKITPLKLMLIIWGPIVALALIFALCVGGMIVFGPMIQKMQPHEKNKLTGE